MISDITVPFAEGLSIRDRFLAHIKTIPPNTEPNTLRVFLVREPFDDYYMIILDNGQSEELEDEDVRAWLSMRGADEDLISRAITQAWNFYSAMVIIKNPKTPKLVYDPLDPVL